MLLLVVNYFCASWLAFGVGTFDCRCHGLAIFGNDRSASDMVLPASLLLLRCEGIGVDLFDRDGIPRRTSDRIFLAVVFGREAAIDRSTVLPLPGDSLLNPTVNRLQDYRETVTGFVPGVVVVDLATFLFQVPIELSAPYIAMVVIATPITSLATIFRIVLPLSFDFD